MPYALLHNGTNQYTQLASAIASILNGYIEVQFRVEALDGDSFFRILSDTINGTTTDRLILEQNGNRVIFNAGGGTAATWTNVFPSGIVVGQIITLRVATTGTPAKRLYVDGDDRGTANTDFTSIGRYKFLGVNFGQYSPIAVIYAHAVDYDTAANTVTLDAASSDHGTGTPVLVDTTNGNDGTGVNMPTDGSAWVSLGTAAQDLTAATSEQIENPGISALQSHAELNATEHQQLCDTSLAAVTQLDELNAVQHEQLSDCSLEQISVSGSLDAVTSEQLTDAQTLILLDAGSQQLQTLACEQFADCETLDASVIQNASQVNSEQVEQVSTTAVNMSYLLNCLYAEQVSESGQFDIDSSSNIILSSIDSEQLSHAMLFDVATLNHLSLSSCQQLSQSNITAVGTWLVLDNSPVEQAEHANILSLITAGDSFDFTPHKLTIELVSGLVQIERKTALTIVTRV